MLVLYTNNHQEIMLEEEHEESFIEQMKLVYDINVVDANGEWERYEFKGYVNYIWARGTLGHPLNRAPGSYDIQPPPAFYKERLFIAKGQMYQSAQ